MALEEVALVGVLPCAGNRKNSHFLIFKHLGDKEGRMVLQGPSISKYVALVYVLFPFTSLDSSLQLTTENFVFRTSLFTFLM